MPDLILTAIGLTVFMSTRAIFFARIGEQWWKAFVPLLEHWTFLRHAGLPGFL
jgi:hypothetical protein